MNRKLIVVILGPASWKERFPDSQGSSQSPINISSCYAIVVCSETIPSLAFSPEYSVPPQEMRAHNDGHTGSKKK